MRILIVDDESNIRKTLRVALESIGMFGRGGREGRQKPCGDRAIERFDLALRSIFGWAHESGLDLLDGILRRRRPGWPS